MHESLVAYIIHLWKKWQKFSTWRQVGDNKQRGVGCRGIRKRWEVSWRRKDWTKNNVGKREDIAENKPKHLWDTRILLRPIKRTTTRTPDGVKLSEGVRPKEETKEDKKKTRHGIQDIKDDAHWFPAEATPATQQPYGGRLICFKRTPSLKFADLARGFHASTFEGQRLASPFLSH